MTYEYLQPFREAFEAVAQKHLASGINAPELSIDAQVSLSDVDPALLKTLDRLEPFGHMNATPVFCTHGVTVLPNSVRELKGGHIKLSVRQNGRLFPAIGFRMAGLISPTHEGRPVDIAFTPKFNTWRGETTIQLMLKDIRIG